MRVARSRLTTGLPTVGLLVTILFVMAVPLRAQDTGKLRGTITDAETGEPLPGANIRIEDTNLGASAGAGGVYNILQVPDGTHTVIASFVGFSTTTVQGVEVSSNLTTELDIELSPETLETGEILITAENTMVQQDVTHTQETYTREEMEAAPGITSSMDIFSFQGGAVEGGPDVPLNLGDEGDQLEVREGQLKDIHLRGGRGGEILYLVDGLPITHPIYGGRSVLDLDVTDIERIEIVKGAFSAEYGNAQSAVVKIWTRSGRQQYHAGVKYETDAVADFLGNSFDRQYGTFYLSGLEPLTSQLLPRIGIDALANDVTFFASVNTNLTNTNYNNERRRERYRVLGLLDVMGKQDNTLGANLKLTYEPRPDFRAVLSYNGTWNQWSDYQWLWVGRPQGGSLADHTATATRQVDNFAFHIRHTLSPTTYYNLRLGYLNTDFENSLEGLAPPDYWFFGPDTLGRNNGEPIPYETSIVGPVRDALTGFYHDFGFENPWRRNDTRRYTLRGDFNSQVHPDHMIAAGGDVQLLNLNYIDIQGGGTRLSDYGLWVTGRRDSLLQDGEVIHNVPPPPGPHKLFGQNRWVFNAQPMEGSVFITDKFEKYSLIINAGIRMDWFRPGSSIFEDDFVNQWCTATGLVEGGVIEVVEGTDRHERPVEDFVCTIREGTQESPEAFDVNWKKFRYTLNPRLGVSFPVFERTQIFFSYGHFSQLPEKQYFYRDPFTGEFTGNPGLDWVETIQYEFGFTHQFADNWAADVKTYNKNISEQVGLTVVRPPRRPSVSLWDNKSYARARGLEFKIRNRNRLRTHTSGEATYTAQWAKGYSSSAFDDYRRSLDGFPNPIRERRLGWDVRHHFVLRATLKSPDVNPLELFGIRMPGDWQLTVLTRLSSGQPYTPGTTDLVERQLLFNALSGPPTYRTDVKFRKRFDLAGGKVGLFAEIFNLFDQRNVTVANDYFWFNPWTGEPVRYGDVNQPDPILYSFYDSYRLMSPRQYTLGRRVQFGIQYDI